MPPTSLGRQSPPHPSEAAAGGRTSGPGVLRPAFVGTPLADIATNFRNRESHVARLRQLVASADTRLITVLGRGGIGKSALVAHVINSAGGGPGALRGVVGLSAATGRELDVEEVFLAFGELLGSPGRERLTEAWTKAYLDLPAKTTALLKELA